MSLGGEDVNVIRSARLNEVSLVKQGAVPEAYAKVLSGGGGFKEIIAGGRSAADIAGLAAKNEAAAAKVRDSMRALSDLLGQQA
jgi:hypothetical protein